LRAWRGAASVVAPGTAIGCAHVARRGRAIGESVAQVHGALRTGYRRFEECDVRGHRATVEHLLPDAEHDRVHPEVETVEELLAQEGLHQVQTPDDLHVLVPVTDLAHRTGQIRAELRGPGPREVGPAARGDVLRDAVEERGELVVLATLLVRPVAGEDIVRPPAEQEGVRALVRGTDLRPGDLVQQGRLPTAEREPLRVLVGGAGRLPDEVEGCEQFDVDEAHALLPTIWLSRSGGRPVGAGRLIAATAPSLVLADRLARCIGHHPVPRSASLRRPAGMPCALIQARTSDSPDSTSGSGLDKGGASGPKSRGGLLITVGGVPRAALVSAARAKVGANEGVSAAAPASMVLRER